LILTGVFGGAPARARAKAWEKKSKTWLALAGVLVLFQLLVSRASRKPTPKKSAK